jgi:hypothetical protein
MAMAMRDEEALKTLGRAAGILARRLADIEPTPEVSTGEEWTKYQETLRAGHHLLKGHRGTGRAGGGRRGA